MENTFELCGEWYFIILIGVLFTFLGMVSIKLGDFFYAVREIARNTRVKTKEDSENEYEEKQLGLVNIRGFILSSKGVFVFLGLALIFIGWIPLLNKLKKIIEVI